MGNKVVKHCSNYGCEPVSPKPPEEADKSKTIAQMSREELWSMLNRLRDEREVQELVRQIKRNSGEKETYDEPFKIGTSVPINQLYHTGIKDMKWGVRRFQNRDGTRTPAGKKRDLMLRDNRHGETKEKPKSEDHVKSRQSKAKGIDGLSNDQLKKLNERLQLEDAYKKLTAEKLEKSENWIKDTIAKSGKDAFASVSKDLMVGGAKILIRELSPQLADAAGFGKKSIAGKSK